MQPIVFAYKVYKGSACPIIDFEIQAQRNWIKVEAYVDSGASISLFSPIEAERLKLNYRAGKETFIMVGDGSLIPVYLHKLPIKIGHIRLKVTIGFSPRLGVGFNLLGRHDIFSRFDVTFSDSTKTVSFLPKI